MVRIELGLDPRDNWDILDPNWLVARPIDFPIERSDIEVLQLQHIRRLSSTGTAS